MERYIKECCIISEGVNVFDKIQTLNEGTIGDKFKKFVEWIKGLVAKFTEKLTGLVAKDKTYLEKYKDIILGKKFKDEVFTMPEYFTGLKRISSTAVPQFNYATQEKLLAGENGEFAKTIINDYDTSKHNSFSDFCKAYFQGGSDARPFRGAEIGANVKDMYDFCYDFTKIKNIIETDQRTLMAAAKAGETVLTNASKDNEANRTAENSSFTYSAVYNKFFTEAEADKPDDNKLDKLTIQKDTNTNNNTSSNSDDDKKMSNNINNIQDKDNKVDNDNADAKGIAAQQDISKITNNVKVYTDTCGSLLTAKLTIAEKIRSDFMKIIRHHVQNYVGKVDDKGDNTGKKVNGTNYRNLKPETVEKIKIAANQIKDKNLQGEDLATAQDNAATKIAKETGDPKGDIADRLNINMKEIEGMSQEEIEALKDKRSKEK